MPSMSSQFALSFELTKLPPVRAAILYSADALVSLVRALKRSGSDFLVEEDLAAIFGRGKIEPSLENKFRDVVKHTSITPLHDQSPIVLDAGPGPTVGRALKDRYYMSSVIQMSFLVWMHKETTLATTLVECMRSRYDSEVEGATPDPDYDGILKTLQACSSQTSQYRWDELIAAVEDKFPVSRPWFRANHHSIRFLSPNLLLGAMDYFYLVQSLPEDRLIIVESQTGLLPIIVWGHFILGLVVHVRDSPDGDVAFGPTENPQLIIKWSPVVPPVTSSPSSQSKPWMLQGSASASIIYLLDASLEVLLKTEPIDIESARIEGQECHRLKGYGTTFLQRLFNKKTLIVDDDPIYAETANFVVAFAMSLARSMRRIPIGGERSDNVKTEIPDQCCISTEPWRLFDSSKLLFWGIDLDKRVVVDYAEKLTGVRIADMSLPPGVRNYLEKFGSVRSWNDNWNDVKDQFFENIKEAASWVVTFGQVVGIESCTDLPLRITHGWMFCTGVLSWDGLEPIDTSSNVFFDLVLKMMNKDRGEGLTHVESEDVFLTSHYGWSLFYESVGDCDPGNVNCELLRIKRGVPTNTRTGERKYRIGDGPSLDRDRRTPAVKDKGNTYLPRCMTKVHKRTEHYSSRTNEFWLTVRFDVEDLDSRQWIVHRENHQVVHDARYSIHSSYARFHEALWGAVKTTPCPHPDADDKLLPLDLGTKTAMGLTWGAGDGQLSPGTRIAICLVKGDARARWLVVSGLIASEDAGTLQRRVLLRCDRCCEDCAVKAASRMKGDWLVIL